MTIQHKTSPIQAGPLCVISARKQTLLSESARTKGNTARCAIKPITERELEDVDLFATS